jgi:hypothetical protein
MYQSKDNENYKNSMEESLKKLYELDCDDNKNFTKDEFEKKEKCDDKKSLNILIKEISNIFVTEIIYYLQLKSLFEKLKDFLQIHINDPMIINHMYSDIYKSNFKIIIIIVESISKILEGSKQFIYKFSTLYIEDNKLPEYSKYEVSGVVPGYPSKFLLDKNGLDKIEENYKLYVKKFNYTLVSNFDNILIMIKEYLDKDEVYNSYKNVSEYFTIFIGNVYRIDPLDINEKLQKILLETISPIRVIDRCNQYLYYIDNIKSRLITIYSIDIKFNNIETIYDCIIQLTMALEFSHNNGLIHG